MIKRLLGMSLEKAGACMLVATALLCGIASTAGFTPFARNDQKGMDRILIAMLEHSPSASSFPVAKVIDGDTFVVKVRGGEATIRLMGINTPETLDPRKPVQCFGPEASAHGHVLLDGTTVSLALDHTSSSLDKYGRVLAYATLSDGISYNKAMIADGYAFEYTYKKAYERQKEFRKTQAAAKAAAIGLWSPSTCGGKLIPRKIS